ncbi:MAG: hypothetical protein HYZ72_01575 [Deltaproteobacteria bacterium]|nr:hypothetical protein [Deltaproteobacteria bacterium]
MSDLFTLWLHLLGLAVYFGSGVTLVMVLLPMAAQIPAAPDKQRFLAQGLKLYNPLSIGALGVALMTGAFSLTSYKALFGRRFFDLLGGVLGLKLLVVFVLINVSAAVSLGMGHRVVRTELRGEEIEPERLAGLVKRMQIFTVVALLLTAWIVWISLNLTRIARVPG